MMLEFLEDHSVPGASLAISRYGRLLYSRGFGYRDADRAKPVLPSTRFRIASISKPVTSAAIVTLVLARKLDLDDPLSKFLTEDEQAVATEQIQAITVRQLLQHQAGWDREESFDPMFSALRIGRELRMQSPVDINATINFMLARPLDFQPGTRYAYSNFGYCLLGRIIERVSKMPYDQFVTSRVFKPLGVRTPVLARSLQPAKGETYYTHRSGEPAIGVVGGVLGEKVPFPYGGWQIENMDAHGGWIATASDLVKFADALRPAAKFFPAPAINAMFAPPSNSSQKDRYYALGWEVRRLGGGKFNAWHAGHLAGTSTLLVQRHDGFSWAVLFNMDAAEDGRHLASIIDPLIHAAVNQATEQ
ncbi:MAG: hypothetical protein Aurels2KO_44050 [Aureliella sp.]